MNNVPSIWCVVPCFNRSANTLRFLSNFFQQNYPNKYVVIVDDNCSDNTGFNVEINYPDAHVIYGEGDLWWSGGTNLAIKYALENGADYILTINDDSQFSDSLISTLYKIAKKNPKYIVGSVLVEEGRENIIWSVGSCHDFNEQRLMRLNLAGQDISALSALKNPYPVEMMPGNGDLIPRKVFEDIGFYDEVNFPQYHADSEFMKRAAAAGYQPVIALESIVVNQILRSPLVNNVKDLLFFKKSDLYWPAMASFFLRYYPEIPIETVFKKIYQPFISTEDL
ncbi:glycosyltransferase family 2 protein [Vreelandella sedimenti]|uniref:glycosyltransferase family 2 protein n=1 Tax=Vreelandella sedimenti TaxID=2729618 RepID=UPI0030DA0F3A|tara:strand:- start:4409 stop:5251 length:843 start_codon:yes stop_codon:yes gene_type:complete